jgi:membrane-associated phospholipid phosphatase
MACAEDLSVERSKTYYFTHGALTSGGFLGAFAVSAISGDHGPRYDFGPFFPDGFERTEFSESAAQRSDILLWLTISIPLVAQMSEGFSTAAGNAALIYGEAQAANLFLTTLTKEIVRRPRPYTHAPASRIREFAETQGSDAFVSFYSGHSSTAHLSAMAGSILYAARTTEPWARHGMWGLEFGLAGITAQLRVRAGRHYRTDTWTGALVGAGLGLAIPALHGVDLRTIEPSEWATAVSTFGATMVLGEVSFLCGLLDWHRRCHPSRDVRVPVEPIPMASWALAPLALSRGLGLQLVGELSP